MRIDRYRRALRGGISRRSVLASGAGLLASSAGCADDGDTPAPETATAPPADESTPTGTPSPTATEDQSTPATDELFADLGPDPTFRGLSVPKEYGGGDKVLLEQERSGQAGWATDKANNTPAIYVDVSDDFQMGAEGIAITVRYFDEGDAGVNVQYGTGDGSQTGIGWKSRSDSGKWVESTWVVDDSAALGNNFFQKWDLRIQPGGDSDVLVDRITVRQHQPRLAVEQRTIGNVFVEGETPGIDVQTRGETLEWSLVDYWGRTVDSGEEAVGNGAVALDLPVESFGQYEIFLTAREGGDAVATRKTTMASLPPLGDVPDIDDEFFSMQGHFGFNWSPAIMPLMQKAGIRSFRDNHRWASVETEKGVYEYPEKYQTYMAEADRLGLEPFLIPGNGNSLYYGDRGTKKLPNTEAAQRAYGRFMGEVARHYGDQVTHVEFWNEPNGFWNHPGAEPGHNAELLAEVYERAYPEIKAVAPDVTVVGGALAWSYFAGGDPYAYAEIMLENGAIDYMDAFSIHSYRRQWTPESPTQNGQDVGTFRTQVDRWEDLTAEYNDGEALPIWITEFGWAANEEGDGSNVDVDMRMHAQLIVRSYVMAKAADAERVYWYTFQDKPNQIQGQGLIRDPENPFGRYTPKPTYSAYATMARRLAGGEFQGEDDLGETIYSYRFDKQGETVRAIWTEDSNTLDAIPEPDLTADVTLQADGPVTVTDLMGNERTYEPRDGQIPLTVSQNTVFVEGAVTGVSSDATAGLSVPNVAANEELPVTLHGATYDGEVALRIDGETYPVDESGTVTVPGRSRTGEQVLTADLLVDGRAVGRLVGSFMAQSALETSVWPRIENTDAGEAALRVLVENQRASGSATVERVDWQVGDASGSADAGWSVPAGERKRIRVPLEDFSFEPYREYNHSVKVTYAGSEDTFFEGPVAFNPIPRGSPTIDGDVSEYADGPTITLTEDGSNQLKDGTYDGEADLSGQAWYRWDDDHLTFAAEIVDDEHFQDTAGGGTWQGDSIQFALARPDSDTLALFNLALTPEGPQAFKVIQPTKAEARLLEDAEIEVLRNDESGTTTYEVAIPWDETPARPESGVCTTSFILNDNDGDGRAGWYAWGGDIGSNMGPETLRLAQLLE